MLIVRCLVFSTRPNGAGSADLVPFCPLRHSRFRIRFDSVVDVTALYPPIPRHFKFYCSEDKYIPLFQPEN